MERAQLRGTVVHRPTKPRGASTSISDSPVAGERCLTPKLAQLKLSKGKSWLWDQVRSNPAFPKPFRLSNSARSIVFLESELDAFIAKQRAAALTNS